MKTNCTNKVTTLVIYTKNGTTYQHIFPEFISKGEAESRIIKSQQVGRSAITEIRYVWFMSKDIKKILLALESRPSAWMYVAHKVGVDKLKRATRKARES